MRIQTSVCNSAPKIGLLPFRDWNVVLKVLLSQAEVYDEYFRALLSFANHKISWLNISVNEPSLVDIVDTVKHLDHKGYREVKGQHVALKLLDRVQISSLGFHYDKRLLRGNDAFSVDGRRLATHLGLEAAPVSLDEFKNFADIRKSL